MSTSTTHAMIDNPQQCTATRPNGEKCTDLAVPALGVCHNHLEQSDATPSSDDTADRPVWSRHREDAVGVDADTDARGGTNA